MRLLLALLLVAGCSTIERKTNYTDGMGVVHDSPVTVTEVRRSFLQLDSESTNALVRDGTGGELSIGIPGTDLDVFRLKGGSASEMSIPKGQEASVCQGLAYDATGAMVLGADRCVEVGDIFDHSVTGEDADIPAAMRALDGVRPTSMDTLRVE